MKGIQSLHFRLRRKSLLFDFSLFAQVEPPQLDSTFAPKKTYAGSCVQFCHIWWQDIFHGWKNVLTFRGASKMQDAMFREDQNGLGRLILEGWFVLRIPMMAMSMVISGLDDARRHQSDRQTNNQHARAIRIGGSYGVFLDSWHPRAQPWLPHV